MVRETCDGGKMPLVEETLRKPIQRQEWKHLYNTHVPFYCFVKIKRKKYLYGHLKIDSILMIMSKK